MGHPETRMTPISEKQSENSVVRFAWNGMDKWSRTPQSELEYSYRMDRGNWSPFSSSVDTYYESLPSGSHVFEVRTRDGDWNIDPTPAKVTIRVIPLLWKRPWFITSCAIILGTIALLISALIRTKVKHVVELEEVKLSFFTNLSHELKTTMAVVTGPLDILNRMPLEQDARKHVSMARRNAIKTQQLLNQLLEFRRIKMGKVKINPTENDIVASLKEVVFSQEFLWKEKKQTFTLHLNTEWSNCLFDVELLNHILRNLISNAVKFTEPKGKIDLYLSVDETKHVDPSIHNLVIEIVDNGPGICKSYQEKIFEPFSQSNETHAGKGTGIGLAFTKELTDIWGGKIELTSPVANNRGSSFKVSLPIQKGKPIDLETDEWTTDDPIELESSYVLIVEDNQEFRSFMANQLSEEYRILESGKWCSSIGYRKTTRPGPHYPRHHVAGRKRNQLV